MIGLVDTAAERQAARQAILDLSTSVYAFSALCCAFELGMLDELSIPRTPAEIARRTGSAEALVETVLDVLVGLGLAEQASTGYACSPGLAALAGGPAKQFLIGDLRSTMLQSAHLAEKAHRGAVSPEGWHDYSDPELLEAQGMRSAEPVAMMAAKLFPMLDGLEARLAAPGARLLDVGTGVGRLAIEMCRQFPTLSVVGLDPYTTPLDLARRNVAEAGLDGRIQLRPHGVEELEDTEQFDLAWVPVMFLTPEVAARGLERVHAALRPGGWALLASLADEGDGLQQAVGRLLAVVYGSHRLVPDKAGAILQAAGYDHVVVLPPFPGAPVRLTIGRRPSE
jgi:2-polyprenyl-3-methyl-5-hydroxy-6-metoxy-1,4-benzoquinol methylase